MWSKPFLKSWVWFKFALLGQWSGNCDRYVSPRLAPFYRLKALVCLALGLEPPAQKAYYELDGINLTFTNGGHYLDADMFTVYWYEAIYVGRGFWRNWWCTVYQETS